MSSIKLATDTRLPAAVRSLLDTTLLVPLLITFFFAFLLAKNPAVVDDYLEALLLDYRFKIRNFFAPPPVPQNIVIVAIDEPSLARHGRWPWSRSLQGELVEQVFAAGPSLVVLDIFFPESESREADSFLAGVMVRNRDRLASALVFDVEHGRKFAGELPETLYDTALSKIENLSHLRSPVEAWQALIPSGPLAGAATYGHVYTLSDRNGKLRSEVLFLKMGEELFPSLALQAARMYEGVPLEDVRVIGGVGVELGGRLIPTDEHGRMDIDYYGREKSFRYVSAAEVLDGTVGESALRDCIVLVGTSAIATYDLKNTTFSANMPGVEKNATVIANILDNRHITRAPLNLELLAVLLTGALLISVGRRRSGWQLIVVFTTFVVLYVAANSLLFIRHGIHLSMVYPLATMLTAGTYLISNRFLAEEARARKIRRMFSSYVTERVVKEMVAHPELAHLGGERRELTILFSDIRGFTTFSEKHAPEEVVALLNEYYSVMIDVIFHWEGTLDKFIGDAIVAFWGAPLRQEDHATRALRCSLHMVQSLGKLNEKWMAEGKPRLDVGIGINTGEVLVGNIGAEGKKMDYTVIGDHVNLAARVEALTKKYAASLMVTEFTLAKIRALVDSGRFGHINIVGLGRVVVKGKEEPVEMYALVSTDPGTGLLFTPAAEGEVVYMKEK